MPKIPGLKPINCRPARTRSGIGIVVSIKIPEPGPGKAWRGLMLQKLI